MFVFRRRPEFTEGERHFYWALFGIGILAAAMACVITIHLSAHEGSSLTYLLFTLWTIVAGFIGGICGFLSSYNRWLGFPGKSGWVRAAAGAVLISGITAVVSGTLILPYYGTMFAPFQFIIAMIEWPYLAVIWGGIMVCAHKLLTSWRRERDSIFKSAVRLG